jgi:hypothetical protein
MRQQDSVVVALSLYVNREPVDRAITFAYCASLKKVEWILLKPCHRLNAYYCTSFLSLAIVE